MVTEDPDVHRRTFDIGLKAMAEVKRHRTSAEPAAYELWYEHVMGHHRKLSAALAARSETGRITDADIRELHANYLSSARVSERIGEIGAGAQAEMRSALDVIRRILGDLSVMDADLQATAERLAEPGLNAGSLRDLAQAAIAATRKVSDANAALEGKLTESESSIATLQLALEEARGAALTDGLTGLFNRRAFDEQYNLRFARACAENLSLCLLMLDIDHFKLFNDTHGHMIGDQVIRLVGSSIKQRLGPPDVPARFGGEEFVVICLGRSRAEAAVIAEDIRRRIDGYEIVQQGTNLSLGKVTVSVGVAALRAGDTASTLLQRTDERLYAAKRMGRNRVATDLTTA